jgi:hypothetical protein
MKKVIKITFAFLLLLQVSWAQSNWEFVGPKSDNQTGGNGFETSRLNNITIDPQNPLHLFASGEQAGLWESTDRGANWLPVANAAIGSNGVSAVGFLNSSEALIGNNHALGKLFDAVHHNYSTGAWKYNFVTQTWTSLGAFPNPLGLPYKIRQITTYPGSTSILFACTTIGLFKSTDGGVTWSNKTSGFIENIVFVPYAYGYYSYIAGSNLSGNYEVPTGTLMVKESFDVCENFTDYSSMFAALPVAYNTVTHSRVCVSPANGGGNVKVFLYTIGSGTGTGEFILSFNKNVLTGVTSSFVNESPSGIRFDGTTYRMAVAYDGLNAGVWFGGTKLSFFKSASEYTTPVAAGFHSNSGKVHDDIHDIRIETYSGQLQIYVACDGGLVRSDLNFFSPSSPTVNFYPLNNGIHVCLLNGFSGTDNDPNLYAIGGQDIVNSDVYDATTGKNKYTKATWENDGAHIDKYNKDNMFFDLSSYNAWYYTSVNGGLSFEGGGSKGFYDAHTTSPTFAQGTWSEPQESAGFTTRLFYQDPYRANRIFFARNRLGIFQYDYTSKTFVAKIDPLTIQPNYNSSTGTGDFGIMRGGEWSPGLYHWGPPLVFGMSFSPITKNSLHFAVNGSYNPAYLSRPCVIKYIGNNIDDCWKGHNEAEYTDGTGTHPQWATLTDGLWESLGLSADDMHKLVMTEIETSPWNPDIIYLSLSVPNHDGLKVLKYDGSVWTDYSNGIPLNEPVYSMIMDHQSNDALYLSTNMGVYYRDATGSAWTLYTNGLPKMMSKQMEINYTENTVRTGTYGRGIWKSQLLCPVLSVNPIANCANCNTSTNFFYEGNVVSVSNTQLNLYKMVMRATDYVELLPGTAYTLLDPAANTYNYYEAFIHGCSAPGNSFRQYSDDRELEDLKNEEMEKEENAFVVFPNPNNGSFSISFASEDLKNIEVYDAMGRLVYKKQNVTDRVLSIETDQSTKGIYLVKVIIGAEFFVKKVVVQ